MSDRAQRIADARALLDWLEASPDVPIARYWEIQVSYHVTNEEGITDRSGRARVRDLAEQIGGEYEVSGGSHHYAIKRFGTAVYQASYIESGWRAEQDDIERLGREAVAAKRLLGEVFDG